MKVAMIPTLVMLASASPFPPQAIDCNPDGSRCHACHTGFLKTGFCIDCPSSPAERHAAAAVEFRVDESCYNVNEEILARIAGNQDGSWADPHNSGSYFLDGSDSYTTESVRTYTLDVRRQTGPASASITSPTGDKGPFTDKMSFVLEPFWNLDQSIRETGCSVRSCSVSQVTSVADGSTGYCNMRNLFCGSDAGCTPVKTDATFTENIVGLSLGFMGYPGSETDAGKCIVTAGVSV